MTRTTLLRRAGLVLLAGAIVAGLVLLPINEYVKTFVGWVKDLGPWGPVALAAAYVPACLLFFPGSILTLGAGFAFGLLWGTVAVSAGSVVGVAAAFWAGRTLARRFIEERVSRNPKFRAIDQAVAEQGAKIVLLTRLSPAFPFNLLNYAFGLTRVRFRDFILASWIGMLPGTILYVYIGSAAMSLTDLGQSPSDGGTGKKVLLFVGLAATIVVTVFVTRIAKRALSAAVPANQPPAIPTPSSRPSLTQPSVL